MGFYEPFVGGFNADVLKVEHSEMYGDHHVFVPSGGIALTVPAAHAAYKRPSNELRVRGTNGIDGPGKGLDNELWVGFRMKVNAPTLTDVPIVVSQWLRGPDSELENPSISLQVYGDLEKVSAPVFRVLLRAHPHTLSFQATTEWMVDTWYSVVCHYKPTRYIDGFARVWLDGVLICDYSGATIPPQQADDGFWKLGPYVPRARHVPMVGDKTVSLRELRYAGVDGSYKAVAPREEMVMVAREDLEMVRDVLDAYLA